MKHLIPEDQRGRTIANIIVVFSGILLTAVMMYFDKIWSAASQFVSVASPFIIGFAIAFLLLPILNRMESFFNTSVFRRKPHPRLSRILSTGISVVVLLAMIMGFFAILVPQLVSSIKTAVPMVVKGIQDRSEFINDLLLKYNFLTIEGEQLVISWDTIVSRILNYRNVLLDSIVAISGSIYTMVFKFLVGLIAAVYVLIDKEHFSAVLKKICYALFKSETCETLIYWARQGNTIFAGFISGKVLDSLIIGVICYVGMLIMKLEYPLLISVIIGLTNVIPFFGPFIGAVPSILILLLVNPMSALWFTVFVIILQQLDGNVIGPFILGDYVGLSAFWIMAAILMGGGLFGFTGMLLSVPVFALMYAIIRTLLDARLKKRGLPREVDFYRNAPDNLREDRK